MHVLNGSFRHQTAYLLRPIRQVPLAIWRKSWNMSQFSGRDGRNICDRGIMT